MVWEKRKMKYTEKQKEKESDEEKWKQKIKKMQFLFIIDDCQDCFSPLFILKETVA